MNSIMFVYNIGILTWHP